MKCISDWYKKPCYHNTYVNKINPINPLKQWPKTGLAPMTMSAYQAKHGRPNEIRRLQHDKVVPRRARKIKRKYIMKSAQILVNKDITSKRCLRRTQQELVLVHNTL